MSAPMSPSQPSQKGQGGRVPPACSLPEPHSWWAVFGDAHFSHFLPVTGGGSAGWGSGGSREGYRASPGRARDQQRGPGPAHVLSREGQGCPAPLGGLSFAAFWQHWGAPGQSLYPKSKQNHALKKQWFDLCLSGAGVCIGFVGAALHGQQWSLRHFTTRPLKVRV